MSNLGNTLPTGFTSADTFFQNSTKNESGAQDQSKESPNSSKNDNTYSFQDKSAAKTSD